MGAVGSAVASILGGLAGNGGSASSADQAWDHVWYPGERDTDTGSASTLYDGTASGGCSTISNGSSGTALRIPAGNSFTLGAAANIDVGRADYTVETRCKFPSGIKSSGGGIFGRSTSGAWASNDRSSMFVLTSGHISVQEYGISGVTGGQDLADDTWRVLRVMVHNSPLLGRRVLFFVNGLFIKEGAWAPSADSAHADLHIGPITSGWSGPIDVDYLKYRKL